MSSSDELPAGKPGKNPIHAAGRSGDDVRHSKEDALSDREFVLLLEGARKLSRSDYEHNQDHILYSIHRENSRN